MAHFAVRDGCANPKNNVSGIPAFVLIELKKIKKIGGKSMIKLLAAVDFAPVIAPILEVLNAILWPAIAIIGAVGTIYCIVLGVKLAKSDEQNSREKAKKDLIGAVVGFVAIFVLIVALKVALPILQAWVQSQI